MGQPEPRDRREGEDPFTVFRPEVFEPDLRSMTRIVPVGRLGPARHATQGSLAMQLRDIERQAGVRRTL
jgi:hypothetical protein